MHGADPGSIPNIQKGSPRLPAVISEHRAGSGTKIKKRWGRDPDARDRGLCSPRLSSLSGLCCVVVSPTMARHPMQGQRWAVSTAQSVSGLAEGGDRTHPTVGAFLHHLCRGQGTRPRPTGWVLLGLSCMEIQSEHRARYLGPAGFPAHLLRRAEKVVVQAKPCQDSPTEVSGVWDPPGWDLSRPGAPG